MTARDDFDRVAGHMDYPMLIVTARAGDERSGCLVGFATQTSIHPQRFLVCISRENRTYEVAARAPHLGVHLVPAHATALAELFGGETGDEVDKFARCAWHAGPEDVPILDDCPDWFVGRVLSRSEAGDHDAFLLEPVAAHAGTPAGQLTFRRARRIEPGHPA